jgi:hypothetical protein
MACRLPILFAHLTSRAFMCDETGSHVRQRQRLCASFSTRWIISRRDMDAGILARLGIDRRGLSHCRKQHPAYLRDSTVFNFAASPAVGSGRRPISRRGLNNDP